MSALTLASARAICLVVYLCLFLSAAAAAVAAATATAATSSSSWPNANAPDIYAAVAQGQKSSSIDAKAEPAAHVAARMLIGCGSSLDMQVNAHGKVGDYSSTKSDPVAIKVAMQGGQLKVYRPAIFNSLRRHAGVSDDLFLRCLDAQQLVCLSSDSKSGQAFWKSRDETIVLKTLKHYECLNLLRVLDKYAAHALSDISCIAQVLGVYRVKTKGGACKYFIACKNVYPKNTWHLVRKYDLKGSTVGRAAAATSSVQKDLDLMASNLTLAFGNARPLVLHALQRDVNFLRAQRFMDYSLLVAVEKYPSSHFRRFLDRLTRPLSSSLPDRGKLVVLGSDGLVYHVGIIDFLQRYSFRKVLETWIKALFYDANAISCVRPGLYARRMYNFIFDKSN